MSIAAFFMANPETAEAANESVHINPWIYGLTTLVLLGLLLLVVTRFNIDR